MDSSARAFARVVVLVLASASSLSAQTPESRYAIVAGSGTHVGGRIGIGLETRSLAFGVGTASGKTGVAAGIRFMKPDSHFYSTIGYGYVGTCTCGVGSGYTDIPAWGVGLSAGRRFNLTKKLSMQLAAGAGVPFETRVRERFPYVLIGEWVLRWKRAG